MSDDASADQLRRALVALRDLRSRYEALEAERHEPVAVVGLACRLPGAPDADALWALLRAGGDAITETPVGRWDADSLYDTEPDHPGTVATRWGGFLDDLAGFDAAFFGISPREAAHMDPQQRLLLEVAWEALEDAGQPVARLAGQPVGVFVGVHSQSDDYYSMQAADIRSLDLYSGTGTSHSVAAGRLSYLFDLRGPSLAVDTACSSSLVAVHLAVQSLRSGESSMALVGGVNAILEPTFTMVASRMRMMSPSGRCRPFDAMADGFVRSEGCGVVVLKRLSDAVTAGDRVLAVIRGSAVNQDGRSSGLTAPNSRSQEAVIRAALEDARTGADAVGLIEAHGTGTSLGDPIEVEALSAVFGTSDPDRSTCALGSVKANVGHTEGAAGVVALIKAVQCLRHGEIPPLVHFTKLNPHIDLDRTPFHVPVEVTPWEAGEKGRIAGVSSFGWSGTNAHLVVGEAPPPAPAPTRTRGARPLLLPVSARADGALLSLASEYRDRLVGASQAEADALGASAARHREHHDHRLVVTGRTAADLVEQLESLVDAEPAGPASIGRTPFEPGLTGFVFPGQGSQWPAMARGLLDSEPVFRSALADCSDALAPHLGLSLVDHLAQADPALLDEVGLVQPALFAVQVALAALWADHGVHPDVVVGHSMGEVAAAHVAGILALDDAALVISRRSDLLRRIAGRGAMAVVDLDPVATIDAIGRHGDSVSVAVVNSPTSTVIAGEPGAVDEVVAALRARDVFSRRVNVDVASHSPQVEPLVDELIEVLAGIRPQQGTIPFWSTVSDGLEGGLGLDGTYWARNLREPVRFGAAARALVERGHTRFVEVGPHPVLLPFLDEAFVAAGVDGVAVPSMRRDGDEGLELASSLGRLYVAGVDVDWEAYAGGPSGVQDLPTYPWQRESHWIAGPGSRAFAGRGGPQGLATPSDPMAIDPGSGWADWTYTVEWCPSSDEETARMASGAVVVVADDGGPAGTIAAQLATLVPDAAVVAPGAPELLTALRRADRVVFLGALDTPEPAHEPAALVQAERSGPAALLGVLGALDAIDREVPIHVVTRGAWIVSADDTTTSAGQALVWGLGRAIGEEHPESWGGLIDLDPEASSAAAASDLVAELARASASEVAIRGGIRYEAQLVPDPVTEAGTIQLRPDSTCLVTGGFGAVGRPLADRLVDRGARRLVLLGRTALPARDQWTSVPPDGPVGRRIAFVRHLEARGVAVHTAAVDVGDVSALRSFLSAWSAEGRPPIRSVFHAAAVLGGELLGDLGVEDLHAQLAPKVAGTWALAEGLPELDHLVLFSSIASTLPFAGQSAYAAANAFVESTAEGLAARGVPAVSVAWPYWEGTDEVLPGEVGQRHDDGGRGFKATARALTEAVGMDAMTIAEGLALLEALTVAARPRTVVAPVDWAVFGATRGMRTPRLVGPLVEGATAGPRRASLAEELADRAPDARLEAVRDHVRAVVGEVVRLAPSRIDDRQPFGSLGFDSLLALDLRNRLEASVGMTFPATVAWNHPTVEELSNHVLERLVGPSETATPSEPSEAPARRDGGTEDRLAEAADAVRQLSDDEALTALLEGSGP